MRIGFYLTGSATAGHAELLAQVELADRRGFDSVWLRERHFHSDYGGRNFFSAPMTVAAWIAARTARLRIGLGARILPLDHPLHVAEDAATVDLLSGGRLDLGIARIGENPLYEAAFGRQRQEARGRFTEAVELIELAWRGEPFSFRGEHFTVPRLTVLPRPLQRPGPPIHLVGISELTLDFGARRGLPLLLAAAQPESEVRLTVEGYHERLGAAGHDPETVATPLNRFVYVADTTEHAREEMRAAARDFLDRPASVIRDFLGARAAELSEEFLFSEVFICGDAEHCAERIEGLRDRSGVGEVLATFNYFTLPHERCRESMERFTDEVLPRLRGSSGNGFAHGSVSAAGTGGSG